MKSYREIYREYHGRDIYDDLPVVLAIAIAIGVYYLLRAVF